MAVLAIGVAGAAAGFGVGYGVGLGAAGLTTAIGIGWSVGTVTGQYLYGPAIPDAPDIVQEGPRLGDTVIKGGSYGQSIARVWGQDRLAAGIIWKQPIREEIQTEVIGGGDSGGGKGSKGGGGGGSTTITNYFYYGTFAAQVCEGPVEIKRIWMNSKLVRDPDNGRTELDPFMTFYAGDDTQLPDPLMESYEGVGNVPAYRNVAYIVFNDLPLADFNNTVPNIEVEVTTQQDPPTEFVEAKSFTHTSAGGQVADRVLYVDGSTLWTMSDAQVTKEVDHMRVRFSRAEFDIESGLKLFYEDDIDISNVMDLTDAAPTLAWFPVKNSPFFYAYARYETGVFPGLFPDVPGDAQVQVAIFDIRYGSLVSTYIVPSGAEGGLNESYYSGAWDGVYIYLVRSREGQFVISRMPEPFSNQGSLDYQYLDLSGSSYFEITTGFAFNVYIDRTYCYVLFGSTLLARYRWDKDSFQWFARGEGDDAIDMAETPWLSNLNQSMLFAETAIYECTSWQISPETGGIKKLATDLLGGSISNYWRSNAVFGEDFAIGSSGIWRAFSYTYDNNVSDIIDEACARSGLLPSEYDTSLIRYSLLGYIRASPMSGRGLIQALQRIMAFDAVETDGKIRFVPQDDGSGETGLTILEDDLAAHMYGTGTPDEIRLTRAQELEMPREIRVRYKSLAQDYDAGVAKIPNPVTPSRDAVTIELPAVLDENEAKNIARRFLNQTLWNRITAAFSIPTKLIALEPTDIVTVSASHGDYKIRITNIGLTAPSVLTLEGNVTDAEIYRLNETSDQISRPPATLPPIVESFVGHFDIPILREADAAFEGHYSYGWGPVGVVWPGATLYLSGAAGLWIVGTYWSEGKEATHGSVTAPAGGLGHPFQWDDINTIDVQLDRGTLTSSTDLDVQAGANTAAVGVDGRWEIIGFVNVVDNGGGSYTLSRLMRARRGTEHNTGTGQAGDKFVLLDEIGVRRVNLPAGSTGLPSSRRFVSKNDRIANVSTTTYTNDGTGSTPFAPWRIESQRDGTTQDLTIRWTQRSRCAIEGYLGEDYPVCETIVRFEVDLRVIAGGAVLRTLVIDDAIEAIYSLAAYQADSGDSGAAVIPALHATLYQISTVVGRGYPGEKTV